MAFLLSFSREPRKSSERFLGQAWKLCPSFVGNSVGFRGCLLWWRRFSSSVYCHFLIAGRRTGFHQRRFQRPKDVYGKQVAHNNKPGRICSKYVEILEGIQL